jgi:hypothetical protein
LGRFGHIRRTLCGLWLRSGCEVPGRALHMLIMDIFEGTEQIQELVISRAISGLRIE